VNFSGFGFTNKSVSVIDANFEPGVDVKIVRALESLWPGTIVQQAKIDVGNLTLKEGTISGNQYMQFFKGTWSGGTMAGPGIFRVVRGGSFDISVATGNAVTLDKQAQFQILPTASVDFTGQGALQVNNGSGVTNQGTFTIQVGTINSIAGFGAILNDTGGTFIKDAAPEGVQARTATVSAIFENAGTVEVKIGDLVLSGGGVSSGKFDVADQLQSSLTFSDQAYTWDKGTNFVGAGTLKILAPVTIPENVTVTVAIPAWLGSQAVVFQPASISGLGTVEFTQGLRWFGGAMKTGGGRTLLGPGGSSEIANNDVFLARLTPQPQAGK
jgi:hypothetical protein